jgi:hypothetical protein
MNPYRLSVPVALWLLALPACDFLSEGPQAPIPALVQDATGSCSRGNGCDHYTYVLMGEGIECYTPVPSAPVVLEIARWSDDQTTYGIIRQAHAVDEPGTFTVRGSPESADIFVDSALATAGTVELTSVTVEQGRKWMVGRYTATLPDGSKTSGEFDASPCP